MRAELERRSTVLADLASRLDSLAPAAPPSPQSVTPPEQAIKTSLEAPSTPAVAVPRFDFFGDTKVRYETLSAGGVRHPCMTNRLTVIGMREGQKVRLASSVGTVLAPGTRST